MRLFIAIPISEQVKGHIARCQAQLEKQAAIASLTPAENLHLTLAFIGETEEISSIQNVLDRTAPQHPFDLWAEGAGRFGDLWWVGVRADPTLTKFALALQNELRREGIPQPHRAYQPHITIARKVSAHAPISLEVLPTAMTVQHVSILASENAGGKRTYTALYTRALKP